MENKDTSIDLTMFSISVKALRSRLGAHDFGDFLELLMEANDKEKLEEFLERTQLIHNEGTDLATSLVDAHYDVLVDQEEKF